MKDSSNMPSVQIGGTEIRKIEYRGQQVVTFAMIDKVHGRPKDTARKRFNDNKTRFVDGEDYTTINQPSEIRTLGFTRPQGGTPESVILITKRGYLKIAKTLGDDKAWEVFDEMLERYFVIDHTVLALPDFTNPAIAARAWAEQYDARMRAERTKAEIGARREATAMNTASQKAKEVKKLQQALDRSQEYATVKRMEKYYGVKYPWHLLRKTAEKLCIPRIEVEDVNYGSVWSYHADVWRAAYGIVIPHETGKGRAA